MSRNIVVAFLFLLFMTSPSDAASRVTAANLAENFIGVSEGFEGAKLTVFGVLKNKADVVVVVEGPRAQALVRPKVRRFGLWISGSAETIEAVPGFYAVVSSRPVEKIADDESIMEFDLDIDQLPFAQNRMGMGVVDFKKEIGHYQYRPDGVSILESNLFRADIFLPPSVPIGDYRVRIYEFANKGLLSSREEKLQVAQVGVNEEINAMAQQRPALYAFLALVLALGIGGGAALVFRKVG